MTPFKATKNGLPVGLLFSFDSLTAAVETTQHKATLLAIEEVNDQGGINGMPLHPVVARVGSDPADYRDAAKWYCTEHGVSVLFGTHMSNQRKAVLPYVEKRDALLFYPTLYEGFEFSGNCIYTGAAPNQNSVQLAQYVQQHFGARIMFIGHNYVFAHESNRIMRDLFEQAGGKVADEVYLPLNAPDEDINRVIARANMLAPDAIYSTVVGSDTIKLYEAFAKSSLRSKGTPIVSLATNEADVHHMTADVAEGHISAAPFFDTMASKESIGFVTSYRNRFGDQEPITAGAEAAYFQVHLFAQAARTLDSLSLPGLLSAFGDVTFHAPQGVVKIDTETHHTFLWPRIARLDDKKAFHIVEEEKAAIRPEPFMIQHSIQSHVAKNQYS